MLSCIAIDDEPLALDLLEDNIKKIPYLQLVATCENALEAMKVLERVSVDLIFLDIQMPGLTGLQFIQSMTSRPMIVLITAYEKYALDGFNLDVIDYLVKPVSLDRFIKAANKARELHELRKVKVEAIAPIEPEFFFVNVDYSLLKVIINDIGWIEGLKDYVKIYLKTAASPVVTRMTMKALEEQLPPSRFIRIHKSYIIAISSITAVRKNSVFIGLMEFTVTDNYYDKVKALVNRSPE